MAFDLLKSLASIKKKVNWWEEKPEPLLSLFKKKKEKTNWWEETPPPKDTPGLEPLPSLAKPKGVVIEQAPIKPPEKDSLFKKAARFILPESLEVKFGLKKETSADEIRKWGKDMDDYYGRGEDAIGAYKTFGKGLDQLPKALAVALLQASQGSEGATVRDKDWAQRYLEDSKKDLNTFVLETQEKYKNKVVTSGLPLKVTDFAEFPQNLAFSLVSMAGGVAVGGPIQLAAPFTGPAAPAVTAAAWTLGTAASGKVAYEMTTYQIMQTYLEAKDEEKRAKLAWEGKPVVGLTEWEEQNLKDQFGYKAMQYGLWEAVPEAISNLAFAKIIMTPLAKMGITKTIQGRIIAKLTGLYGEELLTETITEMGQTKIAGEEGLPGGREIDWTSPADWIQSFKEVAPQTFILTTVMAGTGATVIKTKTKVMESLKNEIGIDHPLYGKFKEHIGEALLEIREKPEAGFAKLPGEGEITPEKIEGIVPPKKPPVLPEIIEATEEPEEGVLRSLFEKEATEVEKEVNESLMRAVKDRGGLKVTKGLEEEMAEIPIDVLRKDGMPADEMVESLKEAGIIFDSTSELIEAIKEIRTMPARFKPELTLEKKIAAIGKIKTKMPGVIKRERLDKLERIARGLIKEAQVGKKIPVKAQIKEAVERVPAPFVKKRETTLLKERIQNIVRGAREGRIVTKEEIKGVQTQLLDIIDRSELELSDKAKFRRTVKNIQTIQQLEKSLPEIQSRIESLRTKASKRTLKIRIKKELKQTKIRKQAGKPVGKFTPEVQKTLEMLRKASLVKKSEAEVIIKNNLEKYKDSIPPESVALENKILSMIAGMEEMKVSDLRNTLNQIRSIKETGRLTSELKKFNRQEQIDQWVNKAVDIITGQKGLPIGISTIGVGELRPMVLKERVQKFMRNIGKGFVGWNDIIDMISALDKTSKRGESWLENFADVTSEENAVKKGERVNSERFVKMAENTLNVKTDREMVRRFREDAEEINLGIFKNARGEEVEIKFTKSEARKRWMEFRDPTLKETFTEGMGYTDEITNSITDFLSDEDIAFAKAQMEFLQEYYGGVDKVYAPIYGVNLPDNKNYSPIKREGIARDESVGFGEFLQEVSIRKSVTSGSLKSRVANIRPLHKQSDIAVLEQHTAEMEHFKGWANKIRDLKAVFGDPKVRTAITREHGRDMLAMVDNFMNDFTKGGIETASRLNGLDKIRGKFNRSILSGKVAIGVKQLTSFVAYAETIPTHEFGIGVADFWKNPIKRIGILMQSEMMKARGKYMERDIKTAYASDAYASFRKKPTFSNTLMLNVKAGDQGAIVVGGWAVYRYHRKMGKTHSEALRIFEKVTSNTQQSADLSKQSYWQRGGSWAKLFTMFKSAPNQFFRKELGAVRNVVHGRITPKQAAKTIVIYHFIIPMLFQWVSDFFRWDPDEQKRAVILGPFNGIFIVGDALDYLVRQSLGMRAFDAEIPIYSIKDDIGKAVKLISDDDIDTEDIFKAIRGLAGAVGAVTGKPIKQAVDMGAGVSNVISGEYEKGIGRIFGWSPFVTEKPKKKKKVEDKWWEEVPPKKKR